jgi:hypothetical protein
MFVNYVRVLSCHDTSAASKSSMTQPHGASVERLARSGEEDGPVLDLELESQLASVAPLAARASDKTHEMLLTGDMAGYRWGLGLDAPILADLGNRIEVKMTDMSMMARPKHIDAERGGRTADGHARAWQTLSGRAHIPVRRRGALDRQCSND